MEELHSLLYNRFFPKEFLSTKKMYLIKKKTHFLVLVW